MQLLETINGQDDVRCEIYSTTGGSMLRMVDSDGGVLRQVTKDVSVHMMRETATQWLHERVQLNG